MKNMMKKFLNSKYFNFGHFMQSNVLYCEDLQRLNKHLLHKTVNIKKSRTYSILLYSV
jgi:hypothetical protein